MTEIAVETEKMLRVTSEAQDVMAKFMDAEGVDLATGGVRVSVQPGGCSGFRYSLTVEDGPQDDDMIETHGQIRVFVDPFSGQYLKGVEVGYTKSMEASGFKFTNPNSTGGCGCGSSFSA